jgi:hypothetical protein
MINEKCKMERRRAPWNAGWVVERGRPVRPIRPIRQAQGGQAQGEWDIRATGPEGSWDEKGV